MENYTLYNTSFGRSFDENIYSFRCSMIRINGNFCVIEPHIYSSYGSCSSFETHFKKKLAL